MNKDAVWKSVDDLVGWRGRDSARYSIKHSVDFPVRDLVESSIWYSVGWSVTGPIWEATRG